MSAKTVFISYRRDSTGRAFARSLKQELTHHGYDVFFDVDSIDAGKWEEQIRKQVPERSHFLLLLTPGALDRCEDQNDWVRREFELAIDSNRNIVPVREESVDLAKLRESCPESMKGLFAYQIATVQSTGFEHDVETLIERYIAPHMAPLEEGHGQCIVSPTRLHHGADHLFGREDELAALDHIWNDPTKKVLTIVAFGGVGKTSLVIEWMGRQAAENWKGFERVFDWSFFSQGTREKGDTASAEGFVAEALRFFGDEAMAQSAASAWDKGARLAQLVGQRRTLLVLDGVEPLQHPPGPLAGELKDPALATLLKGLARSNSGLCIVTTRERVADLAPFRDTTAPEWQLHHLSIPAGVELLKTLGVRGTATQFQQLVERVKGHALTLNLLGRYLARAHGGDIRKSDQVKFEKADDATQGGYAFKTIGAYERWLNEGGKDGARQLAVLRLLGLFDRPADGGCMSALRSMPAIPDLTEPLVGLDEEDWNLTVSALEECGLVSRASQLQTPNLKLETALDAHPLVREYFAKQLREQKPESWRGAHRRLYEHLCETTKEGDEPTLEDLEPLYQAVAHGCQAGLQQEACDKVYIARINHGMGSDGFYSTRVLGAFGSDLGAVACFFETPWSGVSPSLIGPAQAFLINQAAFRLGALGRLNEALEPMRAGMELAGEDWNNVAMGASNLSELELTLGAVSDAVRDAEQSVTYADRGEWYMRRGCRTTLAIALHEAGRTSEALGHLRRAESIQVENEKDNPQLYSTEGIRYCDVLLSDTERAAWQKMQRSEVRGQRSELLKACHAVSKRASDMLKIDERHNWILNIALDHLTLGRTALYDAVLGVGIGVPALLNQEDQQWRTVSTQLDTAVDSLRRSGNIDELPRGLLTRAWLRLLTGARTGTESAQEDLDEAWEIAERGPMRLHMADIHLYRARLFHAVKPYPWNKNPDGTERGPKDDLAAARKLIEQCGYWRRKEELEDAEEAAKNW